jgi:hypothetical protein
VNALTKHTEAFPKQMQLSSAAGAALLILRIVGKMPIETYLRVRQSTFARTEEPKLHLGAGKKRTVP